jgi:peptidoglycan biosynthesis protein MviN/MurJ (putative lipid II flippase)
MVVDIIVSLALYQPLGIAGLVIGTAVANIVMTWLLLRRLTVGFNGSLEGPQTRMITIRIVIASVIMAVVARGIWVVLDALLGRSVPAQIIAMGIALLVAGVVYARIVLAMRIAEARQIEALVRGRLRRA